MPVDRTPPATPGSASAPEDQQDQHANNMESSAQHTSNEPRNSAESGEINANEFRLLKLPIFWHKQPKLWFAQLEKPKLWFAQLECEFLVFQILSDDIKYSTVIRHLDEQALLMVAEISERPPEKDKYVNLKNLLINRFIDSDEKRLRQLLVDVELNDKKPFDLLRELKQLAGGTISNNVLHSIWLQRLPYRVQATLAVVEGSPLIKLADLTDKIMDRESGLQVATITPSTEPCVTKSCDLADLERKISALEVKRSRDKSRSRFNGKRRFRSSSRNKKTDKKDEQTCFYHSKFGNKAIKCTIPCAMSKSFIVNQEN
ncbi:uncharacterized protein LOC115239590 [Formica exsecta]|uniref:uncharacterized protein LOC115239590 n=1 Tax=Formica exsecta TaxID=72781 RepID=UPI001143C133|nr:uncharacterized protein LOC115239590 [Formica exsecta]